MEAWAASQEAVGEELVLEPAGDSVSTWPMGTGRKGEDSRWVTVTRVQSRCDSGKGPGGDRCEDCEKMLGYEVGWERLSEWEGLSGWEGPSGWEGSSGLNGVTWCQTNRNARIGNGK